MKVNIDRRALILRVYILAGLLALFLGFGLYRFGVIMPNSIRVDLDFSEAPATFHAQEVAAIAGGDRVRFSEIKSGFHRRFLIYPEMASDLRFSLLFFEEGERQVVEGLAPEAGHAYKIRVKLNKERQWLIDQCTLPCWLGKGSSAPSP